MTFLIDGYNLFHAVGFAPAAGAARGQFDSARTRFLDWLAASEPHRHGHHDYHVVFDAQNAPIDLGSHNHRGLKVSFSYRQTADDLIESLIRSAPRRAECCVVSNDGRLREAALHGGCQWWTCTAFLDHLADEPPATKARRTNPRREAPTSEKPVPTEQELAELLKAFQEPKLRK